MVHMLDDAILCIASCCNYCREHFQYRPTLTIGKNDQLLKINELTLKYQLQIPPCIHFLIYPIIQSCMVAIAICLNFFDQLDGQTFLELIGHL